MTVTAKSKNERIECFYDSDYDNNTFTLTLPSGKYGLITIRANKSDINGLIETLEQFKSNMTATLGEGALM